MNDRKLKVVKCCTDAAGIVRPEISNAEFTFASNYAPTMTHAPPRLCRRLRDQDLLVASTAWHDLLTMAEEVGWTPAISPFAYRDEHGLQVSIEEARGLAEALDTVEAGLSLFCDILPGGETDNMSLENAIHEIYFFCMSGGFVLWIPQQENWNVDFESWDD